MYAGIETANMITPIAALITWGLSFAGVNKYVKSHSTHDDNGFYMLFSIFVSLAVAIAVAASSKLLIVQTAPVGMGLATSANVIMAIAVVIIWGTSFVGITRYMKSHSVQYDNGFYMLLSAAASLAVAIVAAVAGSKLLIVQTAPVGMGLATTANVIMAIAVVIIWGTSFVGITRYMKSHSAQYDNGFYMLLSTAASLAVAIVAVAAGSRISMMQTAPVDFGFGITPVDAGLFAIFLIVLAAPFKVKLAEKNLEAFLFVMGCLAVTISSKWGFDLVKLAFEEPIVKGIVPAVLVAGLAFFYGKGAFQSFINGLLKTVPMPMLVFGIVFLCGMISSVITAIITSLFLVEIVNLMPMERKDKINLVIITCFSIGLGAVLTPLGEPLSTIAIVKLSGAPYHAGFWYLFDQLGVLIIMGCALCAAFGAFYVGKGATTAEVQQITDEGGVREVIMRAVKVYAFVAALFFLGAGMETLIYKYFTHIPDFILYWVNMVSAILDNATLTAAEIAPAMSQTQITAALMGLLIFGGMLIPGNIPNIISAGKLGITSSEYAKLGVPMGLVLGAIFYVLVFVLKFTPTLGIGA